MVAHGSFRVKFSFITFSLEASDVFQVPTLDSLQPNLDEFMEHFETLTGKILSQVRTKNNPKHLEMSITRHRVQFSV